MIDITLLGATGSIGESTLDVIARHRDKYRLYALTANTSWEKLAALCIRTQPRFAVLVDDSFATEFEQRLRSSGCDTELLVGREALIEVAQTPDVQFVMAAIVGAAGLPATLAAARAGKRVLLANKESLVMAGKLFMEAVAASGAELLPIDSEHNAVFQCLPSENTKTLTELGVSRILLTASGGPFRELVSAELESVTPEEAIAHPNWEMGKKISVDSATMMNKGLEVIEARWLFGAHPDQIDVVVHPQSVIHSMVQYLDGTVLAQLGNPDMRTPIAHALGWPNRISSGVTALDLLSIGQLTFEEPDTERFPCLKLAYQAMGSGEEKAIVLNAANELAVEAFLNRSIQFTDIPRVIEAALESSENCSVDSIDDVLSVDFLARELTRAKLCALH